MDAILGTDGDEHVAKSRRLHFEAYALTAADLKRTAEATESDQPQKVPAAELAAHYDVLQSRVKPLRLVDRLEPSHALVNLAAQMLEDQRVKYVEWARCTSRAQEINCVKEDHALKLLQSGRQGSVRLVEQATKITADTRSDLQLSKKLWIRRGRPSPMTVSRVMQNDRPRLVTRTCDTKTHGMHRSRTDSNTHRPPWGKLRLHWHTCPNCGQSKCCSRCHFAGRCRSRREASSSPLLPWVGLTQQVSYAFSSSYHLRPRHEVRVQWAWHPNFLLQLARTLMIMVPGMDFGRTVAIFRW